MQIEQQILDALEKDTAIDFKTLGTKFYTKGICPSCNEREIFISVEKPYQLACSRTNNCAYKESTRERYKSLWANLADDHPATKEDPHATAKAYMSMVRGFPLTKTERWFEQGTLKLPNGRAAETVRFILWDNFYWDRLINERDIRDNAKDGEKPKKADFKYGTKYQSKCWQPPGQVIEEGDFVYIVEGIFHAIAFFLLGYKAVAAFSCTNLPREFINEHKGKKVTWCLAYDAGNGGETASLKFLKEINDLKEAARISLPHSENIDWDDLYREDKLNDKYLEDCMWRGRMLAAKNAQGKAFALYCWKPYGHTVITYRRETYSVSVDTSELFKELRQLADEQESSETKIKFFEHAELFGKHVSVNRIANCELKSLHAEIDKFTREIKYIFNLFLPGEVKPKLIDFTANNISDRKAFSLALLSKATWREFEGSSPDFSWLKKQWSNEKNIIVETIPFIGYDETARAYVFPEVGYQDGKCYPLNKQGYISFPKCALKTTLSNVSFVHSTKFDTKIISDFITVFDLNGIAALGWWSASLFTRQIKERHQSFPFLELTGEKEAGKTTLIRFLWKLYGRENYEGVDLLATSTASEGRMLSQLSNLPLVAVESDREPDMAKGGRPGKSIDWDNFKKIFDLDGVVMSRGVKTSDNQVNESIFRGAFLITQNASVQGSDAIMSRISHLHCTTAHKKVENREIADKLKTMDVKDLAGYLHLLLTHEREYLNVFFTAFNNHRQRLTKTTSIKSQRVIDNFAQHMASVEALTVVFKNLTKETLEKTFKHLVDRAQDRERRLKADHPIVQQFWETYHFINDQVMTVIDEDKNSKEFANQKLNHSKNPALIAVNLNDFIEQCRKRNQEVMSISDLKDLLPTSRYYRFQKHDRVESRIKNTTVRCMIFEKPQKSLSI